MRNFLYALAINEDFINYCVANATGTSNSPKRIDPDIMMDYKIPANDEYIELYGKTVKDDIEQINMLMLENRKIERTINYTLPLFVNGQIKINK